AHPKSWRLYGPRPSDIAPSGRAHTIYCVIIPESAPIAGLGVLGIGVGQVAQTFAASGRSKTVASSGDTSRCSIQENRPQLGDRGRRAAQGADPTAHDEFRTPHRAHA